MKLHFATGALALAVGLGIAGCNSDTPTTPNAKVPETPSMDRSGPKTRGESLSFPVTGPLKVADAVVGSFDGTFTVTKFGFDEATRQLLVTGTLVGTETFTDGRAPVDFNQVVTTTATLKKGAQTSATSINSLYQYASNNSFAAASCGILLLDLGPLHLDLLGLVVDLNEVVLNITGATGAGNLLGNLLCALTGLLDIPGAISGIINLIDSINNLLGTLGLASPAVAPLLHGPSGMLLGGMRYLRTA